MGGACLSAGGQHGLGGGTGALILPYCRDK